MVKIIFTDREETQPIKNGEQVFRLNKSGTFITGGRNPFLRLGIITAQYADGTLIQSSGQIFAEGGSPGPFDKLFRIVGGTNDGSEFWAVVGTYAEEEKARLTLHDLESRR